MRGGTVYGETVYGETTGRRADAELAESGVVGAVPRWWWACLAVVICEALTAVVGTVVEIGLVGIPWSVFAVAPAIVATRTWWHDGAKVAKLNLVLFAAGMCAATWFVGVLHDPASAAALIVPAATEELAYRVALPVVVAAVATGLGFRWTEGLVAGVVVSAALFTLLPGHTVQAESPIGLLPFVAFSVLYSLVVWRTRNLLGAIITHVTVNLFTFPVAVASDVALHDTYATVRSACVGIVTVAFVAGSYWARADADDTSTDGTSTDRIESEMIVDLRDGATVSSSPRSVVDDSVSVR